MCKFIPVTETVATVFCVRPSLVPVSHWTPFAEERHCSGRRQKFHTKVSFDVSLFSYRLTKWSAVKLGVAFLQQQ